MLRNHWSEQEWAQFIESEVQRRLADELDVPNLRTIGKAVGGVIDAHFRRGDFSRDFHLVLSEMTEEISARILNDLYPLWENPYDAGDAEVEH